MISFYCLFKISYTRCLVHNDNDHLFNKLIFLSSLNTSGNL